MAFVKISEQSSLYNDLEKKSVGEILRDINTEDKKVALAVEKALPAIEKLVTEIVARMKRGGRIFYMGAGTSGRLGVLDASEIPPTFGMDPSWVIGLIAGGDTALRNAVENAEDDTKQGWLDLQQYELDRMTIIRRVYKEPQGNRFLASITPFLIQNIDRPEIHALVLNSFKAFFVRNIQQYKNYSELSVNFIGSIAYYYREVLEEAAAQCGCTVGSIIKSPLEGLIKFHTAI